MPSTCWHQPVNEANRRFRSCGPYSVFDQKFSGGMKVVRTIVNEHLDDEGKVKLISSNQIKGHAGRKIILATFI